MARHWICDKPFSKPTKILLFFLSINDSLGHNELNMQIEWVPAAFPEMCTTLVYFFLMQIFL